MIHGGISSEGEYHRPPEKKYSQKTPGRERNQIDEDEEDKGDSEESMCEKGNVEKRAQSAKRQTSEDRASARKNGHQCAKSPLRYIQLKGRPYIHYK